MLSLESDLRPRRVEVDSLGSEKAQQDYQKVNELEQTFLRVEPYRRSAEYEFRSTRNQRVIADLQGLQSYVQDCEQEAELYRIATMDCEGKDGNFPEVLLAQFLGAHPVIIHLRWIERKNSREVVIDVLGKLIGVLASEHVVLIGSRIFQDVEQLERYFPVGFKNTLPLEPLLRFALDSEVYRPEIVRFFFGSMVGRRQFIRSGLGWIALAEVGYNYKAFSYKDFRKIGTKEQWRSFDKDRKIFSDLSKSFYDFDRPLTNKQRLYLQHDCAVPLRLLLSATRKSIEDKVELHIGLKERLIRVLECAYEGEGFQDPWPGTLAVTVEEVVELEEVEWLEDTAGPGHQEPSAKDQGGSSPDILEEVQEVSIPEQVSHTPTFLTDEELERQMTMRERMAGEFHPLDLKNGDMSLRERYRSHDFQFRKRNARDAARVTRGMGKYESTNRYRMCNHRSHRPLVSRSRCHHCGLKHPNEATWCPLYQYHQGGHILWGQGSVFQAFPCLYCDKTDHVLRMCGELHSYCQQCQIRGHRFYHRDKSTPHPKQEQVDLFKDRFIQYAEFGNRTWQAKGETFHRWGYTVHPGHLCETMVASVSDSEEEGPTEIEERLKMMPLEI